MPGYSQDGSLPSLLSLIGCDMQGRVGRAHGKAETATEPHWQVCSNVIITSVYTGPIYNFDESYNVQKISQKFTLNIILECAHVGPCITSLVLGSLSGS